MKLKNIFILLLALFGTSVAQSDNELHIPEENDNQFPPVIHTELDLTPIEGSGEEELITTTDNVNIPLLENIQLSSTLVNNDNVSPSDEFICPTNCTCVKEGDSDLYVISCSHAELTELPTPLDPRTAELNLENNKLTFVPKDISKLKSLKILKLNNNQIMDIAAGSISELPELLTLNLSNNRLLEYPQDLKNSFGLTKLQEFNLGGNDLRTSLKPETFSIFRKLRELVLPSAEPELLDKLCKDLKDSLVTICTQSCDVQSYNCPNAPEAIDEADIAIPALLLPQTDFEDDDFSGTTVISTDNVLTNKTENEESVQIPVDSNVQTTTGSTLEKSILTDDTASFRSVVINAAGEESKPTLTNINQDTLEPKIVEIDPEPTDIVQQSPSNVTVGRSRTQIEPEIKNVEPVAPNSNIVSNTDEKVAGSTASAKSGGVDKSIIGIIVAGMVVVVAGITIKKNWSSIKNRFSSSSSSPRNANERTSVHVNGTTPEEVPLQTKSPV